MLCFVFFFNQLWEAQHIGAVITQPKQCNIEHRAQAQQRRSQNTKIQWGKIRRKATRGKIKRTRTGGAGKRKSGAF